MLKSTVFALAACGQDAPPPEHGYGADPNLPAPQAGGLPTVNPATAVGWPDGAAPVAPEGFTVTRFAENLDHPRWIYVLPNGDVLITESETGRVFEITESGKIVWQYEQPPNPLTADLYRWYRVDASWPGGPVPFPW